MYRHGILATALVAVLGLAGISQSAQSPETVLCGTTIEKASTKFDKKVYKGIAACLKAVAKCASEQECLAKVLVLDEGKCAIGKLDEGVAYFGDGSSEFNALETNESKLGKAHFKLIDSLDEKCMVPGVVFEGADGIPGITFTPNNSFELGDFLNQDSAVGVACEAHSRFILDFPDFESTILTMLGHPDLNNVAFALRELVSPSSTCP